MFPTATFHIHLLGQVQGVGFRPFVYQLAAEAGLKGWVNNTLDGVHVEFNATRDTANSFFEALQNRAPALAKITHAHLREIPFVEYSDFQIVHSAAEGNAALLLTPDIALCAHCRSELHEPQNRRFGYPFITCTQCGPRFSIIRQLPYDRPSTTMAPYIMCADCEAEYNNPLDGRYFSQTNSCEVCGISLEWFDPDDDAPNGDAHQLVSRAADFLQHGKIIAIKGIGGYLLCADAANSDAIRTLRSRKYRPAKPFAVMYPSLESLAKDVVLSPEEAAELQGFGSPILVLTVRDTIYERLAMEDLSPGLQQIGAMLPYSPLLDWLLSRFGRPIVATSGNLSQAPIVFEDEAACTQLIPIADAVLFYRREIVTPQDDSVMRYSPFKGRRTVLRRSRGLAPTFILPGWETPSHTVLAMGAQMKSAFALACQTNLYLSQYLGDLENFDTTQRFQQTIQHFLRILDVQPEVVITDLHPDYFSTRLGEQLASEMNIPLRRAQHHEAHFTAVLAENQCLEVDFPVLGVIWDGTGLGHDNQIWGGEFLKYNDGNMERVGHLGYFPFFLGDKMPREPRISALAACNELQGALPLLQGMFNPTEWGIYQKLLQKPPGLYTSSIGRLFDAAAALTGIASRCSYEGEAAMLLEQAATKVFRREGLRHVQPFEWDATATPKAADLLNSIVDGRKAGYEPDLLAARFHVSLVNWIAAVARQQQVRHIACSGGVFQNALLTDLCIEFLEPEFQCFFHQQLAPNDESIALGQLIFHFKSM